MGSSCSKRSVAPLLSHAEAAGPRSNSRQVVWTVSAITAAPIASEKSSAGARNARQCAKSICGILEQSFGQVLDSLDLQLASKNNSTLTWAALQLTQLRASLSTELSASGLNPGSTSHLLAVLYTLSVAAPDVVAGILAAQCPAINRIVAMVSVVQVTASAADCAGQKWHEWQNLASAIGMDSVYLPAVLSPASKAILIQLHAAAVSQPPAVFRLQISRASAFADACAHLPTPAASALPIGPCIIAPSFITLPAAQPFAHQSSCSQHSMQQQRTDTQSAQASSSHSSMQQPEGDVSPQASGTRSSSADLVSSSVVERDSPTDRGAHLRGGSREEGEGQGPRKEFFALVGAAMTTPGQQGEALFIYNESAACYWYNTTLRSSADAQRQYCMAGWLAGQALHNRTDLGIRLAPLLWQKVLQGGSFQGSFQSFQSFDPAAAQALQKVACMPGQDLAALLQLEGLPSDTSREAYVQHAVQRVCVEDVQWQSASFEQGFCAAVSLDLLQAYLVRPPDLTAMVSGSSTTWQAVTKVQDVFHVVLDHQLQTDFKDLAMCMWEVINAWETELKQHFLFFVTGIRRLPQPHTEVLRIELPFVAFDLKDHTIMLSRLPQAHTCENILELPNYQESLLAVHGDADSLLADEMKEKLKSIIDDRLRLAITCCNSYGLDDRHAL
ncbi:TPA: hypothetical protein ACH3X3_009841 [Trebouxia sp. C0006]